jgi:hypothetical protein
VVKPITSVTINVDGWCLGVYNSEAALGGRAIDFRLRDMYSRKEQYEVISRVSVKMMILNELIVRSVVVNILLQYLSVMDL